MASGISIRTVPPKTSTASRPSSVSSHSTPLGAGRFGAASRETAGPHATRSASPHKRVLGCFRIGSNTPRGPRGFQRRGSGLRSRPMRVALLTREYPPEVYGGAGVHVEYLATELTRLVGVEVRCFGAP